jgi:hypothetical protein
MFNSLLNAPVFAASPGLPDILQYADMSVITNSECMETYGPLITDLKICVSTTDKRSPCKVSTI